MIASFLTEHSHTVVSMAWSCVLKSAPLGVLCVAGDLCLRRSAARLRYHLWCALLFALVLMPLSSKLVPPVKIPASLFHKKELATPSATQPYALVVKPASQSSPTPAPIHRIASFSWSAQSFELWLCGLWLVVSASLSARLLFGLFRLRRLLRASRPILDSDLQELAHNLWLRSGARVKPRIVESDRISVPVAVELPALLSVNSFILLPANWRSWSASTLHASLGHELAHLQHRDGVLLFLLSCALSLLWFNPVVWLVNRRLRNLMEELCDQSMLRWFAPEEYAQILIEFAASVTLHQNRVLKLVPSFTSSSQLHSRLQRLFANAHASPLVARSKALPAAVFSLFAVSAYLVAAAQPSKPYSVDPKIVKGWNLGPTLSESQAKALLVSLQTAPGDIEKRSALLAYSSWNNQESAVFEQMLWLVEHHPDSQLLEMVPLPLKSPELENRLSEAWRAQLNAHPDSPEVLFHAAKFQSAREPFAALVLLRRALTLKPDNLPRYRDAIVNVYADSEIARLPSGSRWFGGRLPASTDVSRLHAALENSDDPALISAVGKRLSDLFAPGGEDRLQRALSLLRRAITLDPSNPEWQQNLEYGQSSAARRQAFLEIARQKNW
jgi:beta-lactamase regulating signal transducer with metallopeptidase domain